MEYHQVKIGGDHIPIPRSNHSAIVNETQVIICGGLGFHFDYLKDVQVLEFDQ
jgi:hypothetical protein